jgi:hypothetical protein
MELLYGGSPVTTKYSPPHRGSILVSDQPQLYAALSPCLACSMVLCGIPQTFLATGICFDAPIRMAFAVYTSTFCSLEFSSTSCFSRFVSVFNHTSLYLIVILPLYASSCVIPACNSAHSFAGLGQNSDLKNEQKSHFHECSFRPDGSVIGATRF